mgnify:CR=1 FL=1
MVDKLGRMIEFLIGNNPDDDIGSFRWESDKQNEVINCSVGTCRLSGMRMFHGPSLVCICIVK